jgi:hypothetical protein
VRALARPRGPYLSREYPPVTGLRQPALRPAERLTAIREASRETRCLLPSLPQGEALTCESWKTLMGPAPQYRSGPQKRYLCESTC